MSNIIRTVPAILAAAFAATATLTANAVDWTGGQTGVGNTESSPYNIWDSANWSGALGYWNSMYLTVSGKTYIQSGNGSNIGADFCPNSGDFVFMGPLKFLALKAGAANSTVSITKKNGDWTVDQWAFILGNENYSTVVFTNESGNVTAEDPASSGELYYIGYAAGSYAKVVNLSGDWTFNKHVWIANNASSTGIVENVSGTWTIASGNALVIGNSGRGEFIMHGGALNVDGTLFVCNNGNGTLTVKGGNVSVSTGDIQLCLGNGRTGTLTIEGGKVTVSNNAKSVYIPSGTGTINLNGGILETPCIYNAGTATVNFNGGTLKANYSKEESVGLIYNSTVKVGANGGVIDSGNNAIYIGSALQGTGGLTFTGGNTIKLNGNVSYSGATSVTPGTTLAIANSTAKSNILSHGLVLAGVPELNTEYTIFTYSSGGLTDGDLANVTCPIASAFTTTQDGTSIKVTVTALKSGFWTGAAGNNNLSTAGNWTDNAVPGPGTNATILCATPATLTKGASFTPSSITFAEGSAAVTIDGDDITGIDAVTNLSSVSHKINAKVYFTGNIQVKQAAMAEVGDLSKAHVTFAGGAYAAAGYSLESGSSAAVYSRCIFGKYYLASTSSNRWTAENQGSNNRVCVADGSYLYVPYAGKVKELYVGTGGTVDIGDMDTTDRPSYQVKGEMVVTNLTMKGSAGDKYISWDQGTSTPGVFKFNSVTNAMGGYLFYLADANSASKHTFYIGAGGLNFSAGNTTAQYVIGRITDGNYETIRPWYSDFTIARRSDGNGRIILCRNVEFCTDDASGVGRTITIDAITRGSIDHVPKITVSGSGTLKVTQPPNNGNEPIVVVTDSATLEYAAGATFGTGAMTLGAGTTLALTATSSTFTALSNAVTLPSGENEKAKIRIDGQRLRSGSHTILSGVAADADDHVELDLSGTALDGRTRASFSVDGSGNLVLTINPNGLVISVR